MNKPEELEGYALEEEAINLEQQKLPIAAQAKLQQAKRLGDQAALLRQQHSGIAAIHAEHASRVLFLLAFLRPWVGSNSLKAGEAKPRSQGSASP